MVKVVFLHPDLGIGGAERLVVDTALALQKKNYTVEFLTTHHDPQHCFEETRNGTFPVTVAGNWIPRSIGGKFVALLAYVRMLWAAFYLLTSKMAPDFIFCDQVSACVPILKLFSSTPILFYCHFPDLLLTDRKSWLKSLYRAPLDWIEEKSTSMADTVLVNSRFTADVFKRTFKSIQFTPEVLYPSLPCQPSETSSSLTLSEILQKDVGASKIILSVNRYERKKNLPLALHTLRELKGLVPRDVHLVLAGGYDERVTENVEHYQELRAIAEELELNNFVTFLRSPSDAAKLVLLRAATALLYTPANEHFGIVPLEAMYSQVPVVAVASGGPLESILDDQTGFLRQPDPKEFALAVHRLLDDDSLRNRMGQAGHRRVLDEFSFESYANKLDTIVATMLDKKSKAE